MLGVSARLRSTDYRTVPLHRDCEIGVKASRLVTGTVIQGLSAFTVGVQSHLAIGGDAGIALLSVVNNPLLL